MISLAPRLDNTHERRVEAEERRRGRPLWNHHHTRFLIGPSSSSLSLSSPLSLSSSLMITDSTTGRTILPSEWRCLSGFNKSTSKPNRQDQMTPMILQNLGAKSNSLICLAFFPSRCYFQEFCRQHKE